MEGVGAEGHGATSHYRVEWRDSQESDRAKGTSALTRKEWGHRRVGWRSQGASTRRLS